MNFFKHKKEKFGLITAILLSALLIPKMAKAAFFEGLGLSVVETLVRGFLFIFQYIAGMLVTLGGGLVDFTLDININQLGSQTEIISIGWQVARDVANLGFVLAIIIIALATIVRFKEYSAKKLLPKLIGAALIVNFSLAIAGVFLDFSHTLTRFFIDTQMQGIETVGENITAAFGPQKFYTQELAEGEDAPPPDFENTGSDFSGAFLSSILGAVFSVVFTFLAFLTLIALSILLIIRFVYIAFLLIISPIAWLFWVIPGLEGQFKTWWDKFLQWTFFAPAVSFFIYLALVSVDSLSANMSAQTVGSGFSGGVANIITQGSQMVIVAGLLIGGLFAAQEMGIKGSKTAIGIAKNAGGNIKGYAQNKARNLGQRAVTAGSQRARSAGAASDEEGRSYAERAASTAAQIPVVGRAFRGTAERIGNRRKELENEVEERQKDLSNITSSDLKSRITRSGGLTNPVEASAYAAEAADRGMTSSLDDDAMEKLISAAKSTGTEDKIINRRPDMASEFGKDTSSVVRGLSSDDVTKVDDVSFENPDVVLNLSKNHVKKLGSKGDPEKKEKIINTINQSINQVDQLDETQQNALNRVNDFIKQNPNWQV